MPAKRVGEMRGERGEGRWKEEGTSDPLGGEPYWTRNPVGYCAKFVIESDQKDRNR
jgi:hypothetical protein